MPDGRSPLGLRRSRRFVALVAGRLLRRYGRLALAGFLNLSGPLVVLTWMVGVILLGVAWKHGFDAATPGARLGAILLGGAVAGALFLATGGWIVRRRIHARGSGERADGESTGGGTGERMP